MYNELTFKMDEETGGALCLSGVFAPDHHAQAAKFIKDFQGLNSEAVEARVTIDIEKATVRVQVSIRPKVIQLSERDFRGPLPTHEKVDVVETELEPGPLTIVQGPLPEDFPGKVALEAAGYNTYAKVRKAAKQDELIEIPGIGPATANKIDDALKG